MEAVQNVQKFKPFKRQGRGLQDQRPETRAQG